MTLYPLSWFALGSDNESDPIHTLACECAGRDSEDHEIGVMAVDHDESEKAIRAAGRTCPPFDEVGEEIYDDHFFLVCETGQGHAALVHVSQDGFWTRC
jgi:hypothetical protein